VKEISGCLAAVQRPMRRIVEVIFITRLFKICHVIPLSHFAQAIVNVNSPKLWQCNAEMPLACAAEIAWNMEGAWVEL
jgi:hypothetical protein